MTFLELIDDINAWKEGERFRDWVLAHPHHGIDLDDPNGSWQPWWECFMAGYEAGEIDSLDDLDDEDEWDEDDDWDDDDDDWDDGEDWDEDDEDWDEDDDWDDDDDDWDDDEDDGPPCLMWDPGEDDEEGGEEPKQPPQPGLN